MSHLQEPIFDIEVIQGNTKSYIIIFPFDISGGKIFFTVKKHLKDKDYDESAPDSHSVIEKEIDCPYNELSEHGKVYLNLLHTDTAIDIGSYFYDIKWQKNDSAGNILQRHTIGTGNFRVNITVTQRH